MSYINFLLLGLANGAVFGSLALALVVTYRSSSVLNFGTGALALVSAYFYAFLRQGQLFIPIPGFPVSVQFASSLGLIPAMAIALVISGLLGLGCHYLIFRPLRMARAVTKAVASLGLMLFLTALIQERAGDTPISVQGIFPANNYSIGNGAFLGANQFWFVVTVILVTAVLSVTFRVTRFGLQTRAVAETEKGSLLSGISADRVTAVNWVISGVVAGIAGILIAPLVPLVPAAYTLFIIPAMAAAILGGFSRLWPAVLGGIGIGVLQSELQLLQSQHSWLPQSGLAELVPLALILCVLLVRARPLPERGSLIQQTIGRAPRPRNLTLTTAVGAVAGIVAILVVSNTYRAGLIVTFIYAIIALSMVVITGYAGQISLAQVTLAGVGGFLVATLTATLHVPFPAAPILASIGAAIIGVLVGLPAIRIRGLAVAVVTLGLAVAVQALWFQNQQLVSSGGAVVSGPWFFGLDWRARVGTSFPRLSFCFMVLAVLVATAWCVGRLRTSRRGSAMLAVRGNERASAASGINVVWTKVFAMAAAGLIAGLGGSLLAYDQGTVTFASFDAVLGLSIFATVYIFGVSSISGAIIASILVPNGILSEWLNQWTSLTIWLSLLSGFALIANLRRRPDGVLLPLHSWLDRRRQHLIPDNPGDRDPAEVLHGSALSEEASASGGPALKVQNICVDYGGVHAVKDVTLEVNRSELVGLIGPNGAGKTTFIDAISGLVKSTGTVEVIGRRVDSEAPHERARHGLGRTFQSLELWEDLTVYETVSLGLNCSTGKTNMEKEELIQEAIDLVALGSVSHRPVGSLPRGKQQLTSIARALVAKPHVLLLDEPAAGLDSNESAWLAERVRSLRDAHHAILLIEHDMSLVFSACDRVEVLNFGSIIASGTPEAVSVDRNVVDAYLGDTHTQRRTSALP